jgi:hypothetical protein
LRCQIQIFTAKIHRLALKDSTQFTKNSVQEVNLAHYLLRLSHNKVSCCQISLSLQQLQQQEDL